MREVDPDHAFIVTFIVMTLISLGVLGVVVWGGITLVNWVVTK